MYLYGIVWKLGTKGLSMIFHIFSDFRVRGGFVVATNSIYTVCPKSFGFALQKNMQ